MRKLIQITNCVRPGEDGGAIFIYGLCDDGTTWELYHGDNVLDWSPLPAVPQDEHFDQQRAKLEIEAWLIKREQAIEATK